MIPHCRRAHFQVVDEIFKNELRPVSLSGALIKRNRNSASHSRKVNVFLSPSSSSSSASVRPCRYFFPICIAGRVPGGLSLSLRVPFGHRGTTTESVINCVRGAISLASYSNMCPYTHTHKYTRGFLESVYLSLVLPIWTC